MARGWRSRPGVLPGGVGASGANGARMGAAAGDADPALLGCGPVTLWTSLFPLEYNVETTLTFAGRGGPTTQHTVTHCRVVDARDSLAANMEPTSVGERLWFRDADGGLLLLSSLDPCRWAFAESLPPLGRPLPLAARNDPTRAADALLVPDADTWRFDDATDPSRIDVFATVAMFHPLATVTTGVMSITDAPVTTTLDAVFPWLMVAEAAHEAAMEEHKRTGETTMSRPASFSFEGVIAEVFALRNGAACPTPDTTAEGPILLDAGESCGSLAVCEPGQERACVEPLGGLEPTLASDGSVVHYRIDARQLGFRGRAFRSDTLPAGAPRENGSWRPNVCFGELCWQPTPLRSPRVHFPAENLYVEVTPVRIGVYRGDLIHEAR